MIIKPRNLIIDNPIIVSFLRDAGINHLCFVPSVGGDDSIIAKYPDYANEIAFGKKWFRIHYGARTVSVRTPGFLSPYAGESVSFFIEKNTPEKNEAFRIKTINFIPKGIFSKNRIIIRNDIPYIIPSGRVIIPKEYIAEYSLKKNNVLRLSIERTTEDVVNSGMLWMFIDNSGRFNPMSYLLKPFGDALRTCRIDHLINLVKLFDKELYAFRYRATIHDDNFNQDVIIFKDQNNVR